MNPQSSRRPLHTAPGESKAPQAASMKSRSSAGRTAVGLLTAALVGGLAEQAPAGNLVEAVNQSKNTTCAELDNGNIPLITPSNSRPISSYVIEARHPKYEFDKDCTTANFDDEHGEWEADLQEEYEFKDPGRFLIFDDHLTVVAAERLPRWWRRQGMTAVSIMDTVVDAHMIVVYKKLAPDKFAEVLVLYQDGNVRLKPLPRVDQPPHIDRPWVRDNVFGSSVIVGPAPFSDRPFVEVSAVQYLRDRDSLEVIYRSGESAEIRFDSVTRESTRIEVNVNYATPPGVALATLRSMYVADDNADVERVAWVGADGQPRDQHLLAFDGARGSEFLFKRDTVSTKHNTSAPDIWIGDFESDAAHPPATFVVLSALAALGMFAFGLRSLRRKVSPAAQEPLTSPSARAAVSSCSPRGSGVGISSATTTEE